MDPSIWDTVKQGGPVLIAAVVFWWMGCKAVVVVGKYAVDKIGVPALEKHFTFLDELSGHMSTQSASLQVIQATLAATKTNPVVVARGIPTPNSDS